MIQELLYHDEENTERCFSNPPVIVKENKRSPLLGYAGIVPVRNLIESWISPRYWMQIYQYCSATIRTLNPIIF